ncbi:hypothetical protein [Paraburkholderia sp. GAS42]|uniref:hypothetical protein n=1 Tax=Paraburkholderia sp. GAS42 TaxID=3035135 RepID=UPI003D211E19
MGLPQANGAAYGKYRYGKRPMMRDRLISFVRMFSTPERRWLDSDDLIQLGLADTLEKWDPADIFKNRGKAYTRFLSGKARILLGLLPVATGGPNGREIRPPKSDEEAARCYQRWSSSIESLGGRLTRCRCLDHCRCMWPLSCYGQDAWEARCEEAVPDDWYPYCPVDDNGELLESIPTSSPLPDHHPSKVKQLRLWFGGRSYSAYPHPLCEWFGFLEANGDDLTEFFERSR